MAKHKIPFLAISEDVGQRDTVAEGTSELSGAYVVEDVEFDASNGSRKRRLVFLGSRGLVQTEVRCVVAGVVGQACLLKAKACMGGCMTMLDDLCTGCGRSASQGAGRRCVARVCRVCRVSLDRGVVLHTIGPPTPLWQQTGAFTLSVDHSRVLDGAHQVMLAALLFVQPALQRAAAAMQATASATDGGAGAGGGAGADAGVDTAGSQVSSSAASRVQVLVLGLGGGTVPMFLAKHFAALVRRLLRCCCTRVSRTC